MIFADIGNAWEQMLRMRVFGEKWLLKVLYLRRNTAYQNIQHANDDIIRISLFSTMHASHFLIFLIQPCILVTRPK